MAKQRHDIGWQKANRAGVTTNRRAAAHRRQAAKRARAAALLEREQAAEYISDRIEEFGIRDRARLADGDAAPVTLTPEPTPAPQPEPTQATPTPTGRQCRHCGEPLRNARQFCSPTCRVAARPPATPGKGSMRDRPHRTLLGSK